jgi:hypothetical protein
MASKKGTQREKEGIGNASKKKGTSETSSYRQKKAQRNSSRISEETLLLDTLLSGFGIKNDAQLAVWLGIDKSLLYATRAGKRRLGVMPRLKVLDHIGFLKVRSLVEAILPERLAHDLVALNVRMVHQRIHDLDSCRSADPNVVVLDEAKLAFGFHTDSDLAEFLALQHNTLATIRAGKSGLGPKPRLRILERLWQDFNADAVLATIESSLTLVRAVNDWIDDRRAVVCPLSSNRS